MILAVVFCVSVPLPSRSQSLAVPSSGSSVPEQPRYVLTVDVDLVNVAATVTDQAGHDMDNLTADDFRIRENGQEQTISFFAHEARAPVSIGVLIDSSGSLQDKLRQGLQMVQEIASALTESDEMFVMTFDSHVKLRHNFTNNLIDIQRSLLDVRPHGETAIYDAISAGLTEMQLARNEKRLLLLVSDGFDTRSKIKSGEAEDLLKRSGVLFYAIGIDDDDNDPPKGRRTRYHIYDYMLNRLADAGGGQLIRLYTGRNYDLSNLSASLLKQLRHEYTIGYYPSVGPTDTRWRNIEVNVVKPGARVASQQLSLQSH
jgi:VWFA-related protein